MGKKASLKINLDYDFDDENGYDDGDYDAYCEDDVAYCTRKREASLQKVKPKAPVTATTLPKGPPRCMATSLRKSFQ
jgi:hypothetical protein